MINKWIGALGLLVCSQVIASELVIESWRADDKALWEQKIIPAFEASHPGIKVTFRPVKNVNYMPTLWENLKAGKAGDLITCRPFDDSLALFKAGHLAEITEMAGMENFPSFAQAPWQTDSGAQTFCVPMASVIHGFFYNKQIFNQLGLSVPKTRDQFFSVLDKVKADGRYVPLAMSGSESWVSSELGFQNIGPNYWKGEDGRLALINGQERLDDGQYVQVFEELARWRRYLGSGGENRDYGATNDLFTSGKAAFYVAGSWEIAPFTDKLDFGVMPPPVANQGDGCFFTDHTDIGMGMNPASKNPQAAMAFLQWLTTPQFAELYTNSLPGFFSLSNHFFEVSNPAAREMMEWRDQCDSTIRVATQILSRGQPKLGDELAEVSQAVLLGKMAPKAAATRLENGLKDWYAPHKNSKAKGQECQCSPVTPLATSSVSVTESAVVSVEGEESLSE
ncbi:ABC transporter substrate-binding protein [Vibrio vulnificus]|nr:ABC transporter substrate-binding protein [Vibrio vulnificus]EGQ9832454.1 carbohydrate ABC transporter substrate-binding protein [Vibrio vulnificus]EGR0236763.1 carbohydrate ABC transporter substrate-binding protein [Vibrio vulnificus]EGR1866189.1 carbohydrate ABC transporter substrate-binding protein [Vibrio vulnificus]ELF4907010.1 carbohydrate ABC transporter substrate-binding protein [Vibrio vulnificus]ELF6254835.1 carbohydrate ABC transporter substrate-binding protein [Vibrio vulnificus